ncbi:unnamed protein product [Larinioides sclopetarius]|uniref:Metalloendopeptidase n=1 Tax=Larinioides sclopetarius TaxID=280406 RepID=A0AAV2AX14_9ARAC
MLYHIKIFQDAERNVIPGNFYRWPNARVPYVIDQGLRQGCLYVGTTIHELGHAIGFYHEQNRSDRDNFLYIYLNNVVRGMEFNFAKLAPSQNLLLTAFDYGSIMIYGNDAFSKDGSPTMVAKNGQKLLNPFDKQSLTSSDAERVKKMYNC